jgi:hypothetical protein
MNKYPLIGGSICAVVLLVLVSSVSASIIPADVKSMKSQTLMSNQEKKSIDDLIWDNGMDYYTAIFSQWSQEYPIEACAADDFSFEKDTYINSVSWIGLYFMKSECRDNPKDMQITFYLDRGDGYAPGTVVAGPIFFYNSQTNETNLEDYWYSYDVTLPEPILILKNQVYWICIQAVGEVFPQWGVAVHLGPIIMHEVVWKCDFFGVYDWEDAYEMQGQHYNMCFKLFGYEKPPAPDLDCVGSLTWTDIKPGAIVTGSFQLMNIGEPDSHLNWTIASYPEWGTWTFTPASGVDLTPEDGAITVNVTVTAPDVKNQVFQGQVKVVNKENSSDYCSIPVTLTTPMNTHVMFFHCWEKLLTRFPLLEELFSLIGNQLGRNT